MRSLVRIKIFSYFSIMVHGLPYKTKHFFLVLIKLSIIVGAFYFIYQKTMKNHWKHDGNMVGRRRRSDGKMIFIMCSTFFITFSSLFIILFITFHHFFITFHHFCSRCYMKPYENIWKNMFLLVFWWLFDGLLVAF